MPARLAAMPRTPLEAAAGVCCVAVDVAEIGARVIERLTATTARGLTTGGGTGRGLTTPAKPMFPKAWGTIGAWAADGAATAIARAAGAVVVALTGSASAEAGSAREATMAPEMTITAEALLAGLAEREMVDESDDAEPKGLGARWRPVFWLDTGKKALQTPTRSAVGFGWETAPGLHASVSTRSSPTERASPQGASLDAPNVGPPLLPSGWLRISTR